MEKSAENRSLLFPRCNSKLEGESFELLMDPLPPEAAAAGNNALWSDRSDLYPLHQAVRFGRTEQVRHLLKEGSSVNEVDWDQIRPLHEACLQGHFEIAKLLIKEGAFINVANIDGYTPLCEASAYGSEACIKLLLANGALVNPPLALSTPLHEAVLSGKGECVQLLVDAGAKLDVSDCNFGMPLHIAALTDNCVCARILLKAGASVNITKIHRSALHIAATNLLTSEMLMQLLEFGADVYARDNKGQTPKELAFVGSPVYALLHCREGNPKTLQEACRYRIRNLLGAKRLRHINELRLPTTLARYLDHQ